MHPAIQKLRWKHRLVNNMLKKKQAKKLTNMHSAVMGQKMILTFGP